MKFLIIFFFLALTGCSENAVTQKHIEKAEKVCSNLGGVGLYNAGQYFRYKDSEVRYNLVVTCKNGDEILVRWVE